MSLDQHKIDYKKSFFEKLLNTHTNDHNINRTYRVMKQFGYHYEFVNGRYYVYTSYEWSVKQRFEQTVKPLLEQLLK